MDYKTLTKLINNEKKNTKGIIYTSINERWSEFNPTSENILDLEKNIKDYSPSVKQKIYKAIENGAWK